MCAAAMCAAAMCAAAMCAAAMCAAAMCAAAMCRCCLPSRTTHTHGQSCVFTIATAKLTQMRAQVWVLLATTVNCSGGDAKIDV